MHRVQHWDRLLVEWADRLIGKPFRWGVTDCGSLVREAVRVMTGQPFAADVFYENGIQAARVWRRTGGTLAYLLDAGARIVAAEDLRHGDLVILPGRPFCGAFVYIRGRFLSSEAAGAVNWFALSPEALASATVARV